jgi:hypothetical protein
MWIIIFCFEIVELCGTEYTKEEKTSFLKEDFELSEMGHLPYAYSIFRRMIYIFFFGKKIKKEKYSLL